MFPARWLRKNLLEISVYRVSAMKGTLSGRIDKMIHNLTMLSLAMALFSSASLLLSSGQVSAVEDSPAPPQDEIVRAIEDHYRGLADLTAQVAQKNDLRSLGKTQTFTGTLFIKKPGRLRLEYTNGQTIVLDGRIVWFHSTKGRQAIKRTFADIEQANIPVAFLLGAAEIRSDFDVVQAGSGGQRVVELLPKKPEAAMNKLLLRSDESGRITAMTVFDGSGNSTEIAFTDVKENEGVDDKLFRFKAPKGTEIIEQ